MLDLLWLVPAIPLLSAAILLVFAPRSKNLVAAIGVGSIAVDAVISLIVAAGYQGTPYTQTLWTWIGVNGFRPQIAFYLDPLSLVMSLVVACVGFLIHLYSAGFMREDEGYSRFFGYMNLFVASMLTLLLGDNLLLLFLGWEGVGLCSYLLIGFWYRDPVNGAAGQKAFIVTRVGDTAFTIGLLLLFTQFGTLQIQELMQRATLSWPIGSALPVVAAAMIVGGAIGKSAQVPLQTWLPDAMVGPTPTSALIHAATMVTAGVYLIARTHRLFFLAPQVHTAVAVIGIVTLLLAGFSALTQSDIKRVLAYSTISQIGYMFLALGVGAWGAAIFHFMTHAFFKALLFLAAGVVIEALHHDHNIFNMGGLRKRLPLAFWTFLAGGAALAGLPLITAGFYSKDLIIWSTWSSVIGSRTLWALAIAGVLLTSLYTFRVIFLVFFGPERTPVSKRPGLAEQIPLIVLGVLAIIGGFWRERFLHFMTGALPPLVEAHAGAITETWNAVTSALAFVFGLLFAYLVYVRRRALVPMLATSGLGRALHRWWQADWGFDWLYDRLFVRPVEWLARENKADFVDGFYNGLARLAQLSWAALSATQTGRVRWYAAGIAGGSVLFLAIVLLV